MGKIIIETKNLKNMIESVKGAVTKDHIDGYFNLIYMQTYDTRKMRVTACDGYKVFVNECDVVECTELDIFIPVIKIPKDVDEQTIIEINDEQINFNFGNMVMSYKRNSGKFGDFNSIFKRENKLKIRVNPKFLKDAIKNMKAAVELQFCNEDEAIIIQNTENTNEKKFILPIKINPYRKEIENE